MRLLAAALLGSALAVLTPAAALGDSSGPGFVMPSGLVTCGIIDPSGGPRGLVCTATYITKKAYDGVGAVALRPGRRAGIIRSGSDIIMLVGGTDPNGTAYRRHPLTYGMVWRVGGYVCTSRVTGLTCRRGKHGFLLSKERQRFF